MTKKLECNDVVPGCEYVATADSEAELMKQVAEHAATVHGVKDISPDLLAKVKAAVQETGA